MEIKIKLNPKDFEKLKKLSYLEKEDIKEIAKREIKGYIKMKEDELKNLSFSL